MEKAENIVKLTKTVVDRLVPPINSGQIIYRDEELKCFGLRITHKGIKSFIVEKRINGKPKRVTLGRYGALTIEQARKEAQKALGKIVTGINPIAEKQHAKIKGMTLKEIFEDYLSTRKSLKTSTRYNYETVINTGFADFKDKPFIFITKDKVVTHHTYLGENHGEDYANLAMRILRALFNFAIEKYEDSQGKPLIIENSVKRLSKTRSWYRTKKRKTYIKPHQLNVWYQAVMLLENELIRDYLLTVLLTGLCRNEAAQLEKDRIDLTAKILLVCAIPMHRRDWMNCNNVDFFIKMLSVL